ncbi:MAG TPA: carboxymuconolactone decarboxylase family protein, partial [Thermoanaerobaculia bacterium]
NGLQIDQARFRTEIGQLVAAAKKAGASGAPPPAGVPVTDAASAEEDMRRTLGTAPEFLRRFPPEGLAGAWTEFKAVQLNPHTALPGKVKELIGLAVAAQIPCQYCIIAHTEFARLNGATDREIAEAVGMASLTRNLSTVLNGMQTDEAAFRQDIGRVVAGARKASAANAAPRHQGRAAR